MVSRFGEGALAFGAYSFVSNMSVFIGSMISSYAFFLAIQNHRQLVKVKPYILLSVLIVMLIASYVSSTQFNLKVEGKDEPLNSEASETKA